jgi:mono/diheme cytochrome c family protein
MKTIQVFLLATAGALAVQSALALGGDVGAEYNLKCGGCHGADGRAATPAGKKFGMKDLTDPKVQTSRTDGDWEKIIMQGVDTPDGKTAMPAYASRVKPEAVKALVKYCRSFGGK